MTFCVYSRAPLAYGKSEIFRKLRVFDAKLLDFYAKACDIEN